MSLGVTPQPNIVMLLANMKDYWVIRRFLFNWLSRGIDAFMMTALEVRGSSIKKQNLKLSENYYNGSTDS